MATYVFENMSQADANVITTGDIIAFATVTANARNVGVTGSAGSIDTTSLTVGTKTLQFDQTALRAIANAGNLVFNDESALLIGTTGNDVDSNFSSDPGDPATIHLLAGNDTIDISDFSFDAFVYGLGGNDNITGSSSADHLYGFNASGGTDGNDTINGGDGGDYIQGNAGNDQLNGEGDSDRIQGGAGNDTITGGAGNDTVNGNTGNDSIDGGADNDSLRGGQGNDSIFGGTGNDILSGDLGNDTLAGGAGVDIVSGGAGNDIFQYNAGESQAAVSGNYETVLDYTDGEDEFRIVQATATNSSSQSLSTFFGDDTGELVIGASGATFTTVSAATVYAQQLLDNNSGTLTDVAVVKVGSDSYLFWDQDGNGAIDSIVKLQGITDTSIFTISDFGTN